MCNRILVIGPSWVGDMMMSQALYRTLLARDPAVKIDVMAPSWSFQLLQRMPEVTQAIAMPLGHGKLGLAERYRLGKQLRNAEYQQAIVLPNSFKSALIPWFAQIPLRTGWQGEMRYGLLNDRRHLDPLRLPRMVQRYVALAYSPAELAASQQQHNDAALFALNPKLSISPLEAQQQLLELGINATDKLIAFCPGAEFGPAKRWPHYHYAVLAQRLIHDGFKLILLGSTKDQAITHQIRQIIPASVQNHCFDLAGKTTLEQAILLMSACQGVVSNDSGLMHIAAALDKPLVALYGPTSPEFTPPLSSKAKVIRLIEGYQKLRHGNAGQGYHQSLIDIQPGLVHQTLLHLLL